MSSVGYLLAGCFVPASGFLVGFGLARLDWSIVATGLAGLLLIFLLAVVGPEVRRRRTRAAARLRASQKTESEAG